MPTVHDISLEIFLPSIDKHMWLLLIEIPLTALQTQSNVRQRSNFHFCFPKGSHWTDNLLINLQRLFMLYIL